MGKDRGPGRGRSVRWALAAFITFILVASGAPARAASDADEAAALAADGLFVRVEDEDGAPANAIYVSAVVRAPAEALWSAVEDVGRYDRFLPLYRETRATPEDETGARRLDFVLSVQWPFFDIPGAARITRALPATPPLGPGFEPREAVGRADFEVFEGTMKGVRGSVWVERWDGGRSRVSCLYLSSRPGLFPAFLTRWALALMVPETVESFGEEARKRAARPTVVRTPAAPEVLPAAYEPGS